ncbi:MAG: hypothetical protein KGL38_01760 [Gemmatimonadota bacterium]|nr:hypothetical protein [Gemmatimonadota bacterium]MDE3126697.1 hypothetical protein [Gemmatimonadota bacterium]MDE3171769.1 hypothetical protein [Gemmatimonadota bacterium]MDE3216097.1 hypothetical protein [Gemmatimonadota bacterium]
MIRRSLPLATMLGLCLAATAAAQAPTDTPSAAAPVAAVVPAPGPSLVAAPVPRAAGAVQTSAPAAAGPVLRASAVTAPAARTGVPLAVADPLPQSVDKHQSETMMIVGGAGLIVGAIIGGTPGTLVMVGGGVLGLFGLYYFLQ